MNYIKLLAKLVPPGANVSLETIVHALERNMNGVEEELLHALVTYWRQQLGAGPVSIDSLRNSFDLFRQSLLDQTDSARPESRYKMLIDTTADDSILRVLRLRKHLDVCGRSKPVTLKLSDFTDDSALQQVTLVSSVKAAAENGDTVVLSQTESVNESFYDLFNQFFQKNEEHDSKATVLLKVEGGRVQVTLSTAPTTITTFHANIAVGSHSKLCKVASGFQCIVHMRKQELAAAPAPFLHRFEKYRISHRHILLSASACSPAIGRIVLRVVDKLHTLVESLGTTSFYGYRPLQTLESIVLRIVSSFVGTDSRADIDMPQFSKGEALQFDDTAIVDAARAELTELRNNTECQMADASNYANQAEAITDLMKLKEAASGALRVLETRRYTCAQIRALAVRFLDSPKKESDSNEPRAATAIFVQWLLQTATAFLLQVCTPERLYKMRNVLPPEMLEIYFCRQEHFSLKRLLKSVVTDCDSRKMIVYTRTTASLLALPVYGLETANVLEHSSVYDYQLMEALICERFMLPSGDDVSIDDFALCPLSQLTSQDALTGCISTFLGRSNPKRVLVFIINMAEASTSRVNFVRLKSDELLAELASAACCPKSIVFVMHAPSANVYVTPCYETTFVDSWETTFIDSVSEEANALGSLDISEWLKVCCGDRTGRTIGSHSLISLFAPDCPAWRVDQGLEASPQPEGMGPHASAGQLDRSGAYHCGEPHRVCTRPH
jgi:hypothetical protein